MGISKLICTAALLLALPLSVWAQGYAFTGPTPFDPALAAQQNRITKASMSVEGLQLEQIAKWVIAAAQVKSKQGTLNDRKVDLESAEKLYKTGAISETALDTVKIFFERAQAALDVEIAKQKLAKATGLKYKYIVLSEGNPKTDFRLKIAEIIKQIQVNNIVIFKAELKGAQAILPFTENLMITAQKLRKKNLTTIFNLRIREAAFKKTRDRVFALTQQVELEKAALIATENTIKALTP